MKKWFDFAIVCLYILGAIGGVGFAVAGDSLPCAAGVVMLAIIAFLAVRAITLPGAIEGIKYYLVPDFGKMVEKPIKMFTR